MNKAKESKTLHQACFELTKAKDELIKAIREAISNDLTRIRNFFGGNKVKIIREFEYRRIFGELVYFPYQWALGISIRYLKCKGMGWMFRMYFGPIKIWFNLKPRRKK